MNLSPKAIAMIQHHEGIRYKPYRCPAKLWTIGVGHVMYPEQGKLKIEARDGFALRPEEHNPSGTCNFSRIDNATLQLVLSSNTVASVATAKVRVYAYSYNVLRVMAGMAGIAYS